MNRKRTTFLLLLLFSNVLSFGQTTVVDSANPITDNTIIIKYRKFQLGVLGNVNRMRFTETPDQNLQFSRVFGLGLGIHAQYNLKKNVAFTLNCLYEIKNWNSSNSGGGIIKTSYNTFHNLTLPILFKYSPTKRNFFIAGGPYIGFVMKKEVKGFGEGTYKYTNASEIGAAFGLGFNIPIDNKISCIIEARDYLNLNNSKALGNYSKMNTACIQLGFFYKFGDTEQIVLKKRTKDSIVGKKVFLKFFYSPQLTYRVKHTERTRFVEYYSDYAQTLSYETDAETPSYGDEYGLILEFKLSPRSNLNTGITVDNQGFSTKPTDMTHSAPSYLHPGTTWSYTETKTIDYKITFISVPLILNYEFKHHARRYFYIGIGVESKVRYNYSIDKGHIGGDRKGLDLMGNYFGIANIGVNIPLAKKLDLFIEPNYKHQVGDTEFKSGNLKLRLWSAGCKVGLKF